MIKKNLIVQYGIFIQVNQINFKSDITFNSLTNLVSICNTNDKNIIWGFINQYDANINPQNNPEFDNLIDYSINYYNDFVLPNKKYLNIDDK